MLWNQCISILLISWFALLVTFSSYCSFCLEKCAHGEGNSCLWDEPTDRSTYSIKVDAFGSFLWYFVSWDDYELYDGNR